MVRQSLPRRRVLALTGSALLGGCLGSTPEGTDPSESTTDDESDAPMTNGPPAAEGSWAQLGRDAGHDGYNPSVPSTCSDVRWTVETEGPLTTPTVANDTVYVTRGNLTGGAPEATLEAYDLSSGDPKWSVSLDTTYVFHAPLSDLRPVYHDGNLYLNVDEAFVVIDAETRRTRWKTSSFDGFINDPPVVTDDAVYGAGRKGLVCFEHDGSKRWEFEPDGRMSHPSFPAVLGDTVYTAVNGELFALDTETGSVSWRKSDGDFISAVVATENEVIQSGRTVRVFDPDGTERWQEKGAEKASIRPALDEETVYCADLNGNVLARELDSGDLRWERNLPEREWAQGTIPTVTDGAVNLLRTGEENTTVYSLAAADGKTNWKISKKGNRARGPIPARETVVFTTEYTPPSQRESKTVSEGLDTTSQLRAFDV